MSRSLVSSAFQNWLPLFAAVLPAFVLLYSRDYSGANDSIATGAIAFIGAFLIFGVGMEITFANRILRSDHLNAVMVTMAIGVGLIMLCSTLGVIYATQVQLPTHIEANCAFTVIPNFEHTITSGDARALQKIAHDASICISTGKPSFMAMPAWGEFGFSAASVAVYIAGVAISRRLRRYAINARLISEGVSLQSGQSR